MSESSNDFLRDLLDEANVEAIETVLDAKSSRINSMMESLESMFEARSLSATQEVWDTNYAEASEAERLEMDEMVLDIAQTRGCTADDARHYYAMMVQLMALASSPVLQRMKPHKGGGKSHRGKRKR